MFAILRSLGTFVADLFKSRDRAYDTSSRLG